MSAAQTSTQQTTPKVYVLHENEQWFDPIRKVLDKRGIAHESIFLDGGGIDLTRPPAPGVYFNKTSASSYTRNHPHAPDYSAAILAWLEAHQARIINPSSVLRLEISKAEQYIRLQQSGIHVPRTIACFGKSDLLEKSRTLKAPFILKPNRGGKGIGIQLIQSHKVLEDYLAHPDYTSSVDDIMLLQEYIKAPQPFIHRLEFIGSKFVYAVKVDTSQGFELCPAEACRIDTPAPAGEVCAVTAATGLFEIQKDFQDPIVGKLEKFLADHSISVAGVEFIRDAAGKLYVYDINTNTNYNPAAEKEAGIFAIEKLADYLEAELRKSVEQDLKIAS